MLSAKGFVDYCRSRGLKYVIKDDFGKESSSVCMVFSDEMHKLPDVSVSLDFCASGHIDMLFHGFAQYNGVPGQKEVLRRINAINAASPFANFVLQQDEVLLICSFVNQPLSGENLTELVFFMVRLCCNISGFVLGDEIDAALRSEQGGGENA